MLRDERGGRGAYPTAMRRRMTGRGGTEEEEELEEEEEEEEEESGACSGKEKILQVPSTRPAIMITPHCASATNRSWMGAPVKLS